MEMILRRFAGIFILVSLLLAYFHSLYWLWFTAFVGFNLLQSSFTNFCPLEMILRKIGVGQGSGTPAKCECTLYDSSWHQRCSANPIRFGFLSFIPRSNDDAII